MATGNLNESLLVLVDGKIVNLRVPYPIGFFTKWVVRFQLRPDPLAR